MSARGQTGSFGDVGSMSALLESGHGWRFMNAVCEGSKSVYSFNMRC
jgi:hypothetical protein